MKKPIVLGNWKMHTTREEARALASAVAAWAEALGGERSIGVAPPACWLSDVADLLEGSGVSVWAQSVHPAEQGAFTGEMSVGMARSAGAVGALVGHSERRHVFGESDDDAGDRVTALRRAELRAVLCVGETLDDRDRGHTWNRVERQLLAGCVDLTSCDGLVVAYEPVWAIGTGRTATPEMAGEVHAQIGAWLRARFGAAGEGVPVLYGGSVKPANASALLATPGIDGLLVGGASLDAESFGEIARA
jgi:triosephosphate isomerase